jgi:uncharacterized protein (TIGR02246 family)
MKTILVIAVAVIIMSCQPKIDKKAEGEKIMQLSREWSKTAGTRDLEKTVSYWADDAVLISAGEPAFEGKDAIRKMVEESYKIPGFEISWEPQSVAVSDAGDMAYLIEKSRISFADSVGNITTLHNKAVSIWRKQQDGSWKNVVDISTPEGPPN